MLLLLVAILYSCKGSVFNKINVVSLVDPDKVPPILTITSSAAVLNGDQDYLLQYDVADNGGGSGVKRIEIYYSPDGAEANFKNIGSGTTGLGSSVAICIPNKNHPQPTFKVVAIDKSGNSKSEYIGNVSGQNYSIATSTPVFPTLTSSNGLLTKLINTQLAISACPQTQCSANSLKYENFSSNISVLFNNAAQPAAADAGWLSCSNVLANKYTTPNFPSEGPHTYKVWTKSTSTEFDGFTALNLISASSNSITVTYDVTPPAVSLNNLTTVGGGLPVSVTFTATDLNGVASNKIQYAADGVTFVDVANNISSPYTWTPPLDNVTTAKLKIISTDNAGNVNSSINNAFTVDSTAPTAPVSALISPYITSSTTATVSVADCTDRAKILISESAVAPLITDANWQNCSTLPAGVSQVLTGPVLQGIHNLYVWAKDPGNNISLSTTFNEIYDTIAPTINLTAFGALYKGGDPITLNFSTTDTNGVSAFKLEYSLDGVTYSLISNLGVGATSYAWTIPVANTSLARFRFTSTDNATTANAQILTSGNFTIDTTPPDTTPLFIEGTVITGKSFGTYRVNDCSDVAKVLVIRGGSITPLATDPGWQTCSQTAYSITTNNFVSGANNLKFWVKDGAENVAPAYLPFTTTYNPPTFQVVDGPTISHPIADITIQFCDEASISKVLFNETGVMPIAADVSWQSCSVAIGALKSQSLSPGAHTLKAFFKYTDGIQSPNPIDVYVNYTSTLTWSEPPSVNRPQTHFTLATCAGIDKVFLNKTTAPLATDPGWQTCTTAIGGLNFEPLAPGVNTINAWFKDSSDVLFSNYASTTATYIPPVATLMDGSTVHTTKANLTISDCLNISKVLVVLDSAATPTGAEAQWVNCSTANNAIESPLLGTTGAHTLYTWFKYTDNYILPDPDIDNITYDPFDITPPDISATTLTLDNGYASPYVPPYLLVKNKLTYIDPTPADRVSRAEFTINTCTPTGSANPKEDIAAVLITSESTLLNVVASDPYWQTCSPGAKAIQSASLADGLDIPLYFYFKDAAGNISGYSASTNPTQTVRVKVDTAADVAPPPRPYVEITTPPTLTMSPAQMWVDDPNSCNDVDQVYVNVYSRKYDGMLTETLDEAEPLKTVAGWQSCKSKPGVVPGTIPLTDTFNFPIILSGSYTLKVWFKDASGNINPSPRLVSFIFDPISSTLPTPLAYWSFDQNHFYKNKMIDGVGTSHLSIYPYVAASVSSANAKIKEGYDFSGNKYALTKNVSALKPTVSVSMSAWVGLTNGDAGSKFIAGNLLGIAGYGLTIDGGFLRFHVNGRTAEVATNTYTSAIHNVVGTSDGRVTNLYIDGTLVNSDDSGAPANIDPGMSAVFAVGVKPNATTNFDTIDPRYFDGKIDELVVWGSFLNSSQVFRHYVDGMNILKVNEQHLTPSPTLASASFYGDFMQNALLTMPTCSNVRFVYVNETTHPPGANSNWQPCSTNPGSIVYPNLAQGYHQLKVWTKDQYDNVSSSYALVDTTITSIVYQAPPEIYFTLDNQHYSNSIVRDLFAGLLGDNLNGAAANQVGVGYKNEGFYFTAASQQSVESLYASPSQLSNKLTISSWARLTQNDNRNQKISGTQSYSLGIDSGTNSLVFSVNTGAGVRTSSVLTSSFASGYHNIIGTYDGRFAALYIDGIVVDSVDYTSTEAITYTCLTSFTIGSGATCNQGPQGNTYFDGGIDEVIIWNEALTSPVISDFFNGQDNVPPLALIVEPKGNSYHVNIPIASFKVLDCSDAASVYVTLGATKPTADAANWQACSTLYKIKTPLLDGITDLPAETANLLHFWFKDAAGNISDTATDVTVYHKYDFTVPNPMAYWPFDIANSHDQIASDVFGGYDATKNNIAFTAGTADEAGTLNGTTSFAEVPYNAAFSLQDKVTLSAWFKIASYPVGLKGLVGNYNNGGYGLMFNGSQLVFRVKVDNLNTYDEITWDLTTLAPAFDFAKWHHVAAIYDRGLMRLFLNSVELISATIPDVGPGVKPKIQYAQNNSFVMGALSSTSIGASGGYLNGTIDEVSTFNDALTDTVIAEIYNRGDNGDKSAYQVTPPAVPVNLNIIYYNSLVSRANLTVTDCTGLDYIIVTNSKFPPDKNDEDWQLCNTMTGGLLSKELSTSDSYGKLWTKDVFGNISRTFNYVSITTKYDKPIQRPAAHWTFDSAHYNSGTRRHIDRLGKIEMQTYVLYSDLTECDLIDNPGAGSHNCFYLSLTAGLPSIAGGVLNGKIALADNQFMLASNTATVTPTDKLSVSSWVYVTQNYDPGSAIGETHIVSTWQSGKGYAIRAVYDPTNPRIEFVVKPQGQTVVAPYLETKNFLTGWHLILGTYDASTGVANLYVDGMFTSKFTAAAPANIDYTSGVKFSVGSDPNTTLFPDGYAFHCHTPYTPACTPGYVGRKYPGSIDEVLVWEKVLTGLEASSLYHNGADVMYPSDTTPPVKPALALENSRPAIDTNRAYFSLASCADISGVLVNEGTKPDKQDDRWQICRTRLGSFGINNLTPGGHTVTFWFKDLAGNVTPVSQDYVIDFLNNPTPRANAYWPMDATHFVSNYTRDVVSLSKEHELVVTGINRDNPAAGIVSGKANEGFDLVGGSYISLYDGLTTATSSRLVRPVNYMTVGGWYYLTNGDASAKTLVDNLYNEGGIAGGYKLYISGSALRFKIGLDLNVPALGSNKVEVTIPTSSYTTGWHHVLGVWTGDKVKLYIDNALVSSYGPLPEINYIRYIDNSNNPLLTYFRIGAESEGNSLPANYFNEKIDEQAVWGFDLTTAQINQAYTLGAAGSNLENQVPAPSNVDNAFTYYYDSFGSRIRITLLSCTNTPYIYIGDYNAFPVQPDPTLADWVDCRTEQGAVLSSKLIQGSSPQYVHVWAKNSFGVVSSIPATLEIPVVTEPDTLILPKVYFSLNTDHFSGARGLDFLARREGTNTGSASLVAAANGAGLELAAGKYFTTDYNFNMHYTRGMTAGFWAYLNVGDATSQILLSPPADPQTLKVYLSGGFLNFNIRRALDTAYMYKSDYSVASFDVGTDENFTINYPTSSLPYSGWYFITTTYDQQNMKLYLNGDLVASDNAPRMKSQSLVDRGVIFTSTPYFRLGDSTTPFTNKVDELMMWDFPLTQKEIIAHYVRVAHQNMSTDVTVPALAGRTLTVKESTFTTKWTSEDSRPYITINDCSDVAGIYIKVNDNTLPRYDDIGWSMCNILEGGIQLPSLTNINADNDIYIWIKDAAGNVNATPLSTVIHYNQDPIPTPVAYWSFDSISLNNKFAFDYGPSHLRTELFGTGATNHTSASDQALTFDANRGYAKVEASSAYKPTNRLSLSYWYNTGANSVCLNDIHLFGTGNKTNGFTVRIDGTAGSTSCVAANGALVFELNLSGIRQALRVPVSQIPSGWVHVVHVFDGRKLFTYFNGGVASGGSEYFIDLKTFKTINYDADQDPLLLGTAPNKLGRPTDLDEYSGASFDEFAVFNHSLFPHQVTDLYNKGIAGTKIYNPARTLEDNAATLSSRFAVFQPTAAFTYGSRIKATVSDCTGMDMVLVNNGITPPSATDSDWQTCNVAAGGILSAPIGTNLGSPTAMSPKIWVKSFNGIVSTNYGTANNAPITMPASMGDISRPTAYWTFDSVSRGHQNATDVFDFVGKTITTKPVALSPSTASAITEDGFSFDGFSTYLKANSSPNTNPMISMTLSSWVYLKKGENSVRTIASNSEGVSGAGLRTSNGQLEFFLYALEQAASVSTINSTKIYYSVGIDTNSYETGWHQVAGTYDGQFAKIYLDGVLVNTYQIQFYNGSYRHVLFHDDVTPWFVGAEPSTTTLTGGMNVTAVAPNSYFDDKIDEFSIFDKALTSTEIYYLYIYGSQFKPGVLDNAIAPTDPGIALEPNAASTSTPFAYFTTPSCVGANGEQINSLYVTVNGAPAPTVAASGWQYCNLDPKGISSPLLSVGSNTITIYLRDNDNDISTAINYTITYTPPSMPNALAYWTFNNVDNANTSYYRDRVGKKDIRADGSNIGYQIVSGKESQGYQGTMFSSDAHPWSYAPISKNWSIGLSPEKDFAISFWYFTLPYLKNGTLFSKPGSFSISRNVSDQLVVTIVTTSGTFSKTSLVKMAPNDWNHLTLTRTGTSAKLFLNAKPILNFVMPNTNLYQSPFQATLMDTQGLLDEVSLYSVGLSDDQVYYNYYLGAKSFPSDLAYIYSPNATPAPIPTSYWTFNDLEIDVTAAPVRKLKDITGVNLLTIKEDNSNPPTSYLSSGQVGGNKKVGEAFYLKRKETIINNPDSDGTGGDNLETENIVGVPEYLEGALPIKLYSNFSLAGWVNFSKSSYHAYQGKEFYTIMDQWGNDAALDQSFRLYQALPQAGNRTIVFEFKTTTKGPFTLTAASNLNLSFSSWHHIAIVRKNTIVTIFIDNLESGSIDIATTEPMRESLTSTLRFGETNLTSDEGRFEGYLDEWAMWENKALTVEQLNEIYNKGVTGIQLITTPVAILEGAGSATSFLNAPLTLNDCGGYSHVFVGFDTDIAPDDLTAGWQLCSTVAGAILSKSLVPDQANQLRLWFKTGAVVSGYTFDINVTHITTDDVAPTPPTISMVSATPTTSAFSTFTLSTCVDGATTIAGVYTGKTGSTPTPSQAGWTSCTTAAGAIKSFPHIEGTNNISFWFKDAAGNISIGAESFAIVYNSPALPIPNIYLPFMYKGGTPTEFSQIGNYIRDAALSIPFSISSPSNAIFKFFGVVDDAAEFVTNSYLESVTSNPSIGTGLSVSAWVNIPSPSIQASIVNQWDGTAANNRFAFTIDSVGRVCFDFQTIASSGSPNWSTNVYRHSCSLEKIIFTKWNHVAIVRNATSIVFYINGVIAGTDTIEGSSLKTSTLPLRVGSQQRGGGYTLEGQVDEVLLYTSNLTQSQIEKIFGLGFNVLTVYEEIQPQAASLPFASFDMDLFNYDEITIPTEKDLKTHYPVNNSLYFTDLDAGAPTNYTTSDNVNKISGESRNFAGKNILESNISSIAITNDFTMSLWVKPDNLAGNGHIVVNKWEDPIGVPTVHANNQFQVVLDENFGTITTKFYYHTTGTTTWNTAGYNVLSSGLKTFNQYDGLWHNLTITRSGVYLSMYVDGQLAAVSNIGSDPFVDSPRKIRLGGPNITTPASSFKGSIDEFSLWDKGQSERQVMKNYLMGSNGQVTSTSIALSAAHHSNTIKPATPVTNASLTISDCSIYSDVLIQSAFGAQPTDVDARWVPCTTAVGAIVSPNLINGANALEMWMKTGSTVDPVATDTITITVTP